MSGFKKTLSKKSFHAQALFFYLKIDDIKIQRNVSIVFSSALLSPFSCFIPFLPSLEVVLTSFSVVGVQMHKIVWSKVLIRFSYIHTQTRVVLRYVTSKAIVFDWIVSSITEHLNGKDCCTFLLALFGVYLVRRFFVTDCYLEQFTFSEMSRATYLTCK